MPPATVLTEPVTNAAGSDLLAGEVVRLSGNATVTRAQADVPANVTGLVGAMQAATPLGALSPVVSNGRGFVLLEPALAPVAGDALWVSAAVAGRGTNVAPALAVYLGVIKDASMYGATGGVIADLAPNYALSTAFNTLHAAYNAGVVAADQEMIVTDAHGGGIVINATTPPPLYTGVTAFEIDVVGGSFNFYRVGGFDVSSMRAITAPVALSTWNANAFLASTLTLTAGGVAPNLLSCTVFEAPTITQTAGVAYVIPVAATITIAGPPAAGAGGGGTPTLTRADALWCQGRAEIIYSSAFPELTIGRDTTHYLSINWNTALMGAYLQTVSYVGPITLDASYIVLNAGGAEVARTSFSGTANFLIGTIANDAATRLKVVASKTIASAAGAVYDGIKFAADTVTLTGNTNITTATGFNKFKLEAPTYSAALALTIDYAATAYISGAPIAAGAGPAAITHPYALWVDANAVRLDGGQVVASKQVLIGASPYTIDAAGGYGTDYCLEVQSNGGAITINLPALTGGIQDNGRIIVIKDSGYNAGAANITIVRGNAGDKINNVAGSYTISSTGVCLWLKANTTNNDWEIV